MCEQKEVGGAFSEKTFSEKNLAVLSLFFRKQGFIQIDNFVHRPILQMCASLHPNTHLADFSRPFL